MSASPDTSKIDKFLKLLQASGLLTTDEFTEACNYFQPGDQTKWTDNDLFAFSDYLVKSQRLTIWQCENLLEGRFKGFYLDHYKILEHIECDEKFSYYRAEDTITKRHVRLRVTPPTIVPVKEGKPQYQVEEL